VGVLLRDAGNWDFFRDKGILVISTGILVVGFYGLAPDRIIVAGLCIGSEYRALRTRCCCSPIVIVGLFSGGAGFELKGITTGNDVAGLVELRLLLIQQQPPKHLSSPRHALKAFVYARTVGAPTLEE
jgi:hypothetical protein